MVQKVNIPQSGEIILSNYAAVEPSSWDWRAAYWISQVCSPPVMGIIAAGLTAYIVQGPSAWRFALLYAVLALLAPTLYVIWLLYQGHVSDLHLQVREERLRPMLATLLGATLAWGILSLWSAPQLLIIIAAANLAQIILLLSITLRWKISFHCSAAAALAMFGCLLLGKAAIWLLLLVPVVAWARLRLRRHTPAQAVAGMVVGGSTLALALMLL